tara:strand:- start:40 stop:222 length:183 start_codon:yes stop_codon:yes gene_type:complete
LPFIAVVLIWGLMVVVICSRLKRDGYGKPALDVLEWVFCLVLIYGTAVVCVFLLLRILDC